MSAEWWTAAEAADRARDPALAEALLDTPLLVVDLRGSSASPARLDVPCPVVALVDGGTGDADVLLTEEDARLVGPDVQTAVDLLARNAAQSGGAAAVLAQVLRTTEGLDVLAALTVESLAYSLLLTGPAFRTWLESRRVPGEHAQDAPAVAVHRDRDVLEVLLDRPAVRNAYDVGMRDGLVEALTLALLDDSLRVVLRGNGPAFCSGGDLRGFGTAEDLVRAHAVRAARHPGPLLHALGERAEVRVHGACVGAGVELPAFAARVVAEPGTVFRLPELAMGTIPGAGGTVSLPRRIGRSRTLLLALSGIDLGADDALSWGLVDAVERHVPA